LITFAALLLACCAAALGAALARPAQPSLPVEGRPSSPAAGATLAFDVLEIGQAVKEHDIPELTTSGLPAMSDVLPKDGTRVRWGILGPGRIAHDFTAALRAMGAHVNAVAAGSLPNALERAQTFADFYAIPRAYGSYEELALDADVDAVYVATTNNHHYANTRLLLSHGKHVLLEKPATISPELFDELADLAAKKKLLLVTNYWSRWFPTMRWARAVALSGVLGKIVHVQGDMAFQVARAAQTLHPLRRELFALARACCAASPPCSLLPV
jgi:hypothetical protein